MTVRLSDPIAQGLIALQVLHGPYVVVPQATPVVLRLQAWVSLEVEPPQVPLVQA